MSVTTDRNIAVRDVATGGSGKMRRSPSAIRPNYGAGVAAFLWLLVIIVPIYMLLKYSVQTRDGYLDKGPLSLPSHLTFTNYRYVLSNDFGRFFLNTILVTAGCVALVLVLAVPAAYAIVRSPSKFVSSTFRLFLFGLAVPAQATIIPVYLIITKLNMYDSLLAIILPTSAFGLPISILVLVGSLRDVPRETYEAMSIDGATATRILFDLVLPFGRSAIVTVGIFTALGAWNGFIFPLLLTQSESSRVLTLSLYNFQGEFQTNVPGLMAAVVLSALPIFALYLFGRRWLLAGLIGMGGK